MHEKDLIDAIYHELTDHIDMNGAAAVNAVEELEKIIDKETFMNMEELFTDGFEECIRNGFYNGFRCAVTLLTQNPPAYVGKPLKSPYRQF
ncbi:MAG: hypothetical protein NC254_13110 [bacterium]|nr:hypothetical protein [bacterium]